MIENIKSFIANAGVEVEGLVVSFIGTIILGFIVIPILKRLKVGQVVREDGPKAHLKKSGTPTTGGIIIILFIMINYILLKYFNQKVLNKDDVILFTPKKIYSCCLSECS